MKGLFFLLIPAGVFFGSVLIGIGWDAFKDARRKRIKERWRKAKQEARWEVVIDKDGEKVSVFVGRVARLGDKSESFDKTNIGVVYMDYSNFQDKVLELQAKAYERAITLNTL